MTVQPEDVEPENAAARSQQGYWASDPNFTWPERLPWSVLGPDFIDAWGFKLPPRNREHLEVIGPSGSGKTYWVETILQQHYAEAERRRSASGRKHLETGAVFLATKADDEVFTEMGWPIVASAGEIRDTNVIVWPRTGKTGIERREFHAQQVTALLDKLWEKNANTLLVFDEVGYAEGLSAEVRSLIQQYWREGRALHIQVVGMKQRPQGALRDMHSETYWTAAFAPKDRSDAERFAELFGHRRDWLPVFDALDPDKHEFILRHSKTREAYISWVDLPLTPQKVKRGGLMHVLSR
jgi:hypothetical protein